MFSTNVAKSSRVVYEKTWGVYTDDPWEVFVMDRKGQAVFPFSRRPVPVNLFQALRAKMAAQAAKQKEDMKMEKDHNDLHIDEKEVDVDFNRLSTERGGNGSGFHRCSTPKSYIGENSSGQGSSSASSASGGFSVHQSNDDKPMFEETEESVDIAAEPWSIASTFEEIDLGHNVSTNSTIPHFLPDRYDKDDDDEESWHTDDISEWEYDEADHYGYLREYQELYGDDDDYIDEEGWSPLPDPYESYDWEC